MITVFSKLLYFLNLKKVSKLPTGEKERGREKAHICVHACLLPFVPKLLLFISYEYKPQAIAEG